MTTTRTLTAITVYWDAQDPRHEGWAYRAHYDDDHEDSGPVEAEPDDLDGAITDACWQIGVELTPDQFAREPNQEGGWADWGQIGG